MTTAEIDWQPIASAPWGRPVLLYLPTAERGNPSFAVGQRWDDDGDEWVWWGPGGPNGGVELDMSIGCYDGGPTLWAELDSLLASVVLTQEGGL